MRKTKEDSEITKQKLLSSALQIFSSLGYDKTRLEDIANEAGFTRGAIYHNFGGKVQIFESLIEEFGISAASIIKDVYRNDAAPSVNIQIFIEESLIYIEENENYRNLQKLIICNNLQLYEELQGICKNISKDIEIFLTYLSDLLQAGIQQGEFKENINIHASAVSILGLINGVSVLWLTNQNRFSIKDYSKDIAMNFLNGLKK